MNPPRLPFADRLNFPLTLILALCLARLWLMPLGSSFWVDEMVTRFVVLHGPRDASLQVAPQVAQSIYYLLPGVMERLRSDFPKSATAFLRSSPCWRLYG